MRALFAARGTAADAAVAVDQIRLAPQLAFPFRGLRQQVVPGDPVVVRRLEPAVVAQSTSGCGTPSRATSRIRPRSTGQPGQDRQIALGDAEGQIDLRRCRPTRRRYGRRAASRPFGPPRGRTGPSVSFHGGASPKSVATICARSRLHGVSCSAAYRAAAAIAAGSRPAFVGCRRCQSGCGGGK